MAVPARHASWMVAVGVAAGGWLAAPAGAGMFAPVWEPARLAVAVPLRSELALITPVGGRVENVAPLGNEISEATCKQLATLAADLNADGNPDLYTTSWSARSPGY